MEETKGRWKRFHESRSDRDREWLILHYLPLVERAVRTFSNVRPDDREDLRGAGYLGLCRALDQWDPTSPGAMAWEDFARFRVRSTMVDHIRAVSWVPKAVRSRAKKVAAAEERLFQRLGRDPQPEEVAAELGLPFEAYERLAASFRSTEWSVASLEQGGAADSEWSLWETLKDPSAGPEERALWREELDALELVLQRLTGTERSLIRWRFLDVPPLSQKEIAVRLQVDESRVSQLLNGAFKKARRLALMPRTLFDEVLLSGQRMIGVE